MAAEREQIMVACEGAACPPCTKSGPEGMCAMCGRWHLLVGALMPPHDRPDILAMIDRGDYCS